MYRGTDNGEFQAHATGYAKRLANDGKYSSQSQIKAAASKFEDFTSTGLRFNEITPELLNDFQDWMANELDNHPNTIRKTINRIKAIHNDAYKKDLASNLPFQDPKFEKVSSVETKKTALSTKQIQAIETLDLETGSWQWHVRNFFIFSFWTGGIRFTDLALLRWKNIRDGRLKYTMGKNGKDKDVLLLPQATDILEHYRSTLDGRYEGMGDDLPPETIATMKDNEFIFHIVDSEYRDADLLEQKRKAATGNTRTNKALKQIAKQAGISTNVTFHISRHSFARWADNSDVMDRKDIQRMLAHSKMETTERYLSSISEYNVDEKMHQLADQYHKN
jgi:integrase